MIRLIPNLRPRPDTIEACNRCQRSTLVQIRPRLISQPTTSGSTCLTRYGQPNEAVAVFPLNSLQISVPGQSQPAGQAAVALPEAVASRLLV